VIRHPQRDGCLATEVVVVTFDWNAFIDDHIGKMDGMEEEQLEKEIQARFMCEELNPEFFFKSLKGNRYTGNNPLERLKKLLIAQKTRIRLREEFDKKQIFKDTEQLLEKYVISVISVKTEAIKALFRKINHCRPGEAIMDNGHEIISLHGDEYKFVWAEIGWSAIENVYKEVLYNANHFKAKEVEVNDWAKANDIDLRTTLKVEWPFHKSNLIVIDERGKTLQQMRKESLEWILEETKNPKSTFYSKTFKIKRKGDFQKLLNYLIADKSSEEPTDIA
jgi:hypothetical protein